MLTKEQLEKRRLGVTGTDISAIMGINPWRTPMDVYLDKIGQGAPAQETESMYWGAALEKVILNRFAKEHPAHSVVHCDRTTVSEGDPLKVCSPDALYTVGSPSQRGVIEVKTGSRSGDWDSGPPNYYLTQLLWYMDALDCEEGWFAVLLNGRDYREHPVFKPDHQNIIDEMNHAAHEFWHKHVIPQSPPKEGQNFGNVHFVVPTDERTINIDEMPMLRMHLEMIAENNQLIDKAKAKNDELKTKVVHMAEGATKMVRSDGKTVASYTTVQRQGGTDLKALLKDHPDLGDKYKKPDPPPYSTLRLYKDKL